MICVYVGVFDNMHSSGHCKSISWLGDEIDVLETMYAHGNLIR